LRGTIAHAAADPQNVLASGSVVAKTAAAKKRALKKRHETLLLEERAYWMKEMMIGGVDEAGAGPLAGPVYAACVVLDQEKVGKLIGVDDSKKLTEKQRAELAEKIKENVQYWSITWATVEEIDRINILQAGLLAMRRAVNAVMEAGWMDHLLVDARTVPDIDVPQSPLIKGDSLSLSIAAASILAKTERDAYMTQAGLEYPTYGFEKHKGYSTRFHLDAIRAYGVTPLHRRSFEPVSTKLNQLELFKD
jgi:ribonuclease HII